MPLFTYDNLKQYSPQGKNIDPEEVYTNKELQEDYTKLTSNGETIAVIIPFHKEDVEIKDITTDDNGTVNISELIRNNNEEKDISYEGEEDTENKERGEFRKRLNDSKNHMVEVEEDQNVYTESSFEFTTIDKI